MKITGFNPSILTSEPDDLIRLFEELGFEKSHSDDSEEGIVRGSARMKYGDFRLDITATDRFPQDKTLIRMNVDDIEAAYDLMLDHGFHNALGDGVIIEAEHFRGAHVASPSGFEIMMMQHKRKQK
jgi:hypothetical protein